MTLSSKELRSASALQIVCIFFIEMLVNSTLSCNKCITTYYLEPPPTFTWTHPHLGDLSSNEDFSVLHEEYQGGSTTTLVIHHAKDSDRGTYSLTAENRNGKETVDLDLIVLATLPDCDCDMFQRADNMCTCSHSYTG